jgi:hypothetical protein
VLSAQHLLAKFSCLFPLYSPDMRLSGDQARGRCTLMCRVGWNDIEILKKMTRAVVSKDANIY